MTRATRKATYLIGGRELTTEQAIALLHRYERALQGLTPGGSEFVNDPEYCAQFVRNRHTHMHETILRQASELKRLREEKFGEAKR